MVILRLMKLVYIIPAKIFVLQLKVIFFMLLLLIGPAKKSLSIVLQLNLFGTQMDIIYIPVRLNQSQC